MNDPQSLIFSPEMELEEAAEVILEGKAFDTCPGCNGSGGLPVIHDEFLECTTCQGIGQIINSRYYIACRTLGKPQPKPSMNMYVRSKIMRSYGYPPTHGR